MVLSVLAPAPLVSPDDATPRAARTVYTDMTALALLLAPITLRIDAPKLVAPGEEVRIVASVTNVSKKPVTLILAILPHVDLGMSVERSIVGPTGAIQSDERGPMMGQWFSGSTVRESSFFVLKPGESRKLYEESFSKAFVGARPHDLGDYAKAPRSDLAPGDYRFRFAYRLDPKSPAELEKKSDGPRTREFFRGGKVVTPEAKRLLGDCWKGEVIAEATFRVSV